MPIYMDLHVGQGITPEMLAKAHQKDLAVQDRFNCRCLTYWLDVTRGNSYCLIEAPDKSAVAKMHWNAHLQYPEEIIEVDERVVKAFLGRLNDPEIVDYLIDQKVKVFSETALRIIVQVGVDDKVQLAHKMGEQRAATLLAKYHRVINICFESHHGVVAGSQGQECVVSFVSVVPAVICSLELQDILGDDAQVLNLNVSIHAGNPVDNHPEIFGNTLQLLSIMNCMEKKDSIVASNRVKKLLKSSSERFKVNMKNLQFLSSSNERFLSDLGEVFSRHWQNPHFELRDIGKELSVSKSQLYRKSVNATGRSVKRLLQEFRLRNALKMLRESKENISQVGYGCGFNSPSYFTKCFHKRYGVKPRAYLHS
ncbi:nickel-binding protein [Arenibacter amylolyticus]|uniref:nickel-binding protein n=1 Tax=Arenibacter amylolyticus TaxID=1406873 RepID=UPI000A3D119F|nr:nickel-binding protein [Arenibacter amylolyticus]